MPDVADPPAERLSVASAQLESSMSNQVSDDEKMLARFQALKKSQHWLAAYIEDLLSAHHLSGGIDFSAAEQLLSAEKDQFEKDLAIARRILRLYGQQIPGENIAIGAVAGS
jgi:hypothetical protein